MAIKTEEYYSHMSDMAIVPDGIVILFKASSSGAKPLLIKLDKKGNFVSKYDARGYGPGELMDVRSICTSQGEILISEFFTPVLHVFSDSLQFKNDIRIKKGGNILFADEKHVAVWSMNYLDKMAYMVTIYNRKDFQFKKYVFPIPTDSVPAFVQFYGTFAPIGNNRYAGVYANDFQIKIFNRELEPIDVLIKNKPKHIKPYRPWKKNRGVINTMEADKWLDSWSVVYSFYHVDKYFLINYIEGKNCYIDVLDEKGKVIYSRIKIKWFHSYCDGKFLWRKIETDGSDDSESQFYLIKEKLVVNQPNSNG